MTKIKSLFATPKKAVLTVICIVAIVAAIGISTVFTASAFAQNSSIGEENAKNFAFADAGIDPTAAENVRAKFDFEQGQFIYDVEFTSDGTEYDYWIKASDGSVVKKELEIVQLDGSNVVASATITADDAKEVALADAGLAYSDVTFTEEKLDVENGLSVYEISFHTDDAEFEYEINANTSAIYSKSKEVHAAAQPNGAETEQQGNSPAAGNPSAGAGSGTAAQGIDLEKAKSIALSDAGVSAADAAFTTAKRDVDDGRAVYEIDFTTSSYEYDYEIDAATGKILSRESEPLKSSGAGTTTQQGSGQGTSQLIGTEKAKSIALSDAGVAAADATFTKTKQDTDDGRTVYEIEFRTSSHEYDYEIDAATGKILSRDSDPLKSSGGKNESTGSNSGNAASDIGVEKAKSIAVGHAGFSASEVNFSKAKLDREDGHTVYDIEFYKDGVEYEYTINASTGAIVEYSHGD